MKTIKTYSILLTAVATFTWCSISNASIINATWNSDNYANLNCTYLYPFQNDTLDMDGILYGPFGRMVGTVTTDTIEDPTLTLDSAVQNDSGGMWIGYQVNVIMSVAFTFTTPGPTVGNPPNNDWFIASTVNPTLQVSGPYAGMYEGTLNYSGGTPIGIGDELDYLYSIHFSGFTSYSFTQEIIAQVAAVPEPGTLALMGMGGLMLALRLRRNQG